MKETRLQFIPPPPPKADPEALALWARRMTVLLPEYLIRMQQVMFKAAIQLFDIQVPVPPGQVTEDAEDQYGITDSAGLM